MSVSFIQQVILQLVQKLYVINYFAICEQILTLLRFLSFMYLELVLQIQVFSLSHVELKSTI